MSEDTLIRFENLDALVKALKWGPSDLAQATKRSKSQCGDMLKRRKSFGEKIARDMEHQLGLPRGWFDQIHDDAEVASASSTYMRTTSSPDAPAAHEPSPVYGAAIRTSKTPAGSGTLWVSAPVVTWADLGEELLQANEEWQGQEFVGAATTQPPSGKRYKGIRANDDSLAPRIMQGDVVIVDPDALKPKRNQVVLLKTPEGTFILRRYTPLASGAFEATDAQGRTLDSERHGLSLVATAIGLAPCDL